MSRIIPIFRMFDYAKAIQFYIDWLEFEIVWEHKPEGSPVYMRIAKGDVVMDLSEHHGDGTPGSRISITEFKGLKTFHAALIQKNYKYMKPGLERAEWNPEVLLMTVIDPFLNTIIFEEPL
ncbi:glyoxalase superfamily protein [Chitinophaga flava]|uniref:Glyoxalase/bleomycin resistance/extradiol dioxygenase family protein n=1 Tax=Chitinophaga flava TaxID=2259036 RepID=A0A365XV40_9BACT|nr:glyoxalase superfamily protein [Chitinophaga flava]RBL90219.1 glyoxalase/bleomycin resistance/extradiol dioxygenase family protein [Chitinophaga flava]